MPTGRRYKSYVGPDATYDRERISDIYVNPTQLKEQRTSLKMKLFEGDPKDLEGYSVIRGYILDVVITMFHLYEKHKDIACILSYDPHNTRIGDAYITWNCLVDTHALKIGTNVKQVMPSNKLARLGIDPSMAIPKGREFKSKSVDQLTEDITRCSRGKSKRMVIIPLIIFMCNGGGHLNYLIYDLKPDQNGYRTIERFEPHGAKSYEYDRLEMFDPFALDQELTKLFKVINTNAFGNDKINYVTALGICNAGPQLIQVQADFRDPLIQMLKRDPSGFCAVWSTWYVDMRLTHPDMSIPELYQRFYTWMKGPKILTQLTRYIRDYGNSIAKFRTETYRKIGQLLDYDSSNEATILKGLMNNLVVLSEQAQKAQDVETFDQIMSTMEEFVAEITDDKKLFALYINLIQMAV